MEAASAVAETFRAALRFRVTLRTVTRSALVWSGRPVMRHAKHPSLSLRSFLFYHQVTIASYVSLMWAKADRKRNTKRVVFSLSSIVLFIYFLKSNSIRANKLKPLKTIQNHTEQYMVRSLEKKRYKQNKTTTDNKPKQRLPFWRIGSSKACQIVGLIFYLLFWCDVVFLDCNLRPCSRLIVYLLPSFTVTVVSYLSFSCTCSFRCFFFLVCFCCANGLVVISFFFTGLLRLHILLYK